MGLLGWSFPGSAQEQEGNSAQQESTAGEPELTEEELRWVEMVEAARMRTVQRVIGSVVAIYGDDKQGGGSGVIIDSNGLALTNHHVIAAAGVSGWGGLADGKLYRWKLVGTDPGGDIAIIQMEGGAPFPFAQLGDSDLVRVGDWAFAMGNPFVLTEDQVPTVTLGIVSGIERYQYGAGGNTLVYGNCIQMDSSINPGNSGGPLFNMKGEIIGINGRGSFQDRGRVNVGLGYAISSNQIKNFIPDLLATKLTEHGTMDANFAERDGKVVCSQIDLDSVAAEAGLELEDELLEFEGIPVTAANQYTNLICTLPAGWPAEILVRKADGTEKKLVIRLLGLPYEIPDPPEEPKQDGDEEPTPAEKEAWNKQMEMYRALASPPGEIRDETLNATYANHLVELWNRQWTEEQVGGQPTERTGLRLQRRWVADGQEVGSQQVWLSAEGRFRIEEQVQNDSRVFVFDGTRFWRSENGEQFREMTATAARLHPTVGQVLCLLVANVDERFGLIGRVGLDGSDKGRSEVAARLKLWDASGDWFYVWLEMRDSPEKLAELAWVRASAGVDRQDPVFEFENWESAEGWILPGEQVLWPQGTQGPRWEVRDGVRERVDVEAEKFVGG